MPCGCRTYRLCPRLCPRLWPGGGGHFQELWRIFFSDIPLVLLCFAFYCRLLRCMCGMISSSFRNRVCKGVFSFQALAGMANQDHFGRRFKKEIRGWVWPLAQSSPFLLSYVCFSWAHLQFTESRVGRWDRVDGRNGLEIQPTCCLLFLVLISRPFHKGASDNLLWLYCTSRECRIITCVGIASWRVAVVKDGTDLPCHVVILRYTRVDRITLPASSSS